MLVLAQFLIFKFGFMPKNKISKYKSGLTTIEGASLSEIVILLLVRCVCLIIVIVVLKCIFPNVFDFIKPLLKYL